MAARSDSSGSSGNQTMASRPAETIRQLVRDLARTNMLLSDEDVFTPSGGKSKICNNNEANYLSETGMIT